MGISDIIVYIMMVFMAIGAIDRAFLNNKLGFGQQFEDGVNAMGALAMAMVGIMCFAPVLGNILTPVVSPIYKLVGADPAMFAGTLLAIDMGGLPLAGVMTTNQDIVNLSGIILGAMMGATIVFSIPVSLGIIEKEDKPFLAKGILSGMIAIPFGCLIGGIVAGINFGLVFVNLIPVFIIAILLAAGLWFIPEKMLKGFDIFSKGVTILITMAFAAAIIEALTGLTIIPGMDPIDDQFVVVGYIAVTLAGAYPLVHFITKVLEGPLQSVGKLIGVNDKTVAGMIATLANNIPMFGMMKEMDERGKVIAVAFSVPAAFAFGDHLGFTTANAQGMIVPMIIGKVLGGVIAIFIAQLFIPKVVKK